MYFSNTGNNTTWEIIFMDDFWLHLIDGLVRFCSVFVLGPFEHANTHLNSSDFWHSLLVNAKVTDGETTQHKAFEYAFGVLGARGFADQEDAHAEVEQFQKSNFPVWLGHGNVKADIDMFLDYTWLQQFLECPAMLLLHLQLFARFSGLDAKASLKTSWELFAARVNYNHGAYKSGDKASAKAEALEKFLLRQGPEFYESIAESIAADRGEEFSRLGVYPSFEDFMTRSPDTKPRCLRNLECTTLGEFFCFHAEGTFARMDEFTKSCSIIVAKQIHFCCLFWPPYHAEVKNKVVVWGTAGVQATFEGLVSAACRRRSISRSWGGERYWIPMILRSSGASTYK